MRLPRLRVVARPPAPRAAARAAGPRGGRTTAARWPGSVLVWLANVFSSCGMFAFGLVSTANIAASPLA